VKHCQKVIAILSVVFVLSLNGCATKNVYLTSDDKIILLDRGESVNIEWEDGGVLMSRGKFERLFDTSIEENL